MLKNILAVNCVLLMVFILHVNTYSQSTSITNIEISGAYMGQAPPGNTAEIFAPGIISTGMHDDAGPIFTRDGNEVFFRIAQKPHSIILHMKKNEDIWSKPEIVSFSGQYSDGVPALTSEGNRIYFASNRPRGDSREMSDNEDIWYVEKTADGWGEPINAGKDINTSSGDWGASVSDNGNLYFTSDEFEGKKGKLKIFKSVYIGGKLYPREALSGVINGYDAACPCIAPDESFIVFTSSDRPSAKGAADLHVSFKDNSGEWTEPVSLGEGVNSNGLDYFPSLSPDGKYLFFVSSRSRTWSYSKKRKSFEEMTELYSSPMNGRNDVYWVSMDVVNKLKPDNIK